MLPKAPIVPLMNFAATAELSTEEKAFYARAAANKAALKRSLNSGIARQRKVLGSAYIPPRKRY